MFSEIKLLMRRSAINLVFKIFMSYASEFPAGAGIILRRLMSMNTLQHGLSV